METADGDGRNLMDEWPEGWFRGEQRADGGPADAGSADAGSADKPGDKTVSIPAAHPGGQYQVRQYADGQDVTSPGSAAPGAAPGSAAPAGGWPAQPPVSSSGRGGRERPAGSLATSPWNPSRTGGPGLPGSSRWRAWLRPKRIATVLAALIAVLLVATVGTYFYLNSKLVRANILVSYPGRPAPGLGTNWLIAGSDSRQGLTKAQERALSTGFAAGHRSDTILILHIPAGGGRPVLISIPRDSYVNIPGYGPNKINAAFSFGGPQLLAKTVQANTGLYINHFMDIGFGGFVRVVNAVGGVRMCLATPLHEVSSGVNLKKGCQTLSGGQALAYVRDRHSFNSQDLQREQNQRLFLKALLKKMTSLGVMLNPFAAIPAASGTASALTVDQGTSLYQLVEVALALRDPITTTVPISSSNYPTAAGDAVLWNSSQAHELWQALRNDKKVPKSLITGSKQV
jgi:LCP family protein required for cell wall assembly